MRPPSTDPNVRRYDRQDEWIVCSQCQSWMLPLADFEIQKSSESPGVGAEPWEFLLWGWWAFVINYFTDLFTYQSRIQKLAAYKQQVLPVAPNSLVCPRCLHVTRRP